MAFSALIRPAAAAAVLAAFPFLGCAPQPAPPPFPDVTTFVAAPERTQGLAAGPVAQGPHQLVSLTGPGVFVSAQVSKQGGPTDLTFVILDIDGRNVVNISYAALPNIGLEEDNPYGLALFNAGSTVETMTIGFDTPLIFAESLSLSVQVNEPNVAQVLANVIHGE